MCLSKAFLATGDKEELLMTDIASVQVKKGKLVLKTLFGQRKEIPAAIREVDFLGGRLVLTSPTGKKG